jgi:AcrR family transcriptional regulator
MTEERPTRSDGRETMERLISFAEKELRDVGPVKFHLARVLEEAGISKSSAYHHFGSRDGIIAAVEMRTVFRQIEENNATIRHFVEAAPKDQSATELLQLLVSFSGNEAGRVARQKRAATVVAALDNPALAQIVGETQLEGARYLAETLQIVVDRGWISPTLPLNGIAHWILTSVFGRVLVDFATDEATNSAWEAAFFTSLIALLKPNN